MNAAQLQRLSEPVLRRYLAGRSTAASVIGWILLGGIAVGFLAATLLNFHLAHPILATISALLFTLSLSWIFAAIRDRSIISILPYFDKLVPGPQTFCHGHALARNSKQVDAFAEVQGLKPISVFGFNDDLMGETVQWHDPADGLATVTGLIIAMESQPAGWKEAAAILADLRRILEALTAARQTGARFCFLVRLGNGASGHEMDLRRGYFGNEWKLRDHPDYLEKKSKATAQQPE